MTPPARAIRATRDAGADTGFDAAGIACPWAGEREPHGGPDAQGPARFDFSSNGNAAGPLRSVARAVRCADRSRYPDPGYNALRERLAAAHDVDPARVVIAGSASEFVHRITHGLALRGRARRALVPEPGYQEYRDAAALDGLAVSASAAAAWAAPHGGDLLWLTEPASPSGATAIGALGAGIARARRAGAVVVIDLAYQPLRLDGQALPAEVDDAWQLWSPNKACGMTGVRGAYAIAPRGTEASAAALRARAPSWVTGVDGVALLEAFAGAQAQDELARSLARLRRWRSALAALLKAAGWQTREAASVTPFFMARSPAPIDFAALRARGIKLRDTTSMGAPGWVRVSAQPPLALAALAEAIGRPAASLRTGARVAGDSQ